MDTILTAKFRKYLFSILYISILQGGWTRLSMPAVPIAAAWQKGALVSRRASHVCSSGIATLIANGIIGRSTKKNANYVPPSYMTRRCSRTLRPRRTVPFAFYQCRRK
jgi:hypothetical protein